MSAHLIDGLDPGILEALKDVFDPEIGVSVVDLGLIYRATRTADGIEVDLTLTTRACPLGELIVEEVRDRLSARFGKAGPVRVSLVWEPIWSPDLITEQGRAQLEQVQGFPIQVGIHGRAEACESSFASRRRRGWRGLTARICGIG